MEGIKQTLEARLKQKANTNIHSDIHALTDEVSSYFGERKKFGMYLGVIKRVGAARARVIFSEVRDSNAKDPAKLFFWKCRKTSLAAPPGLPKR
ncbi:MAG: hypothetical protein WCT10_01615 [Patescibacteria group bacterium]